MANSSSLVKYGSFDLEEAEEAEKELKAGGGGANFLKLEVGKTKIRWIPPKPGQKWRRATHVHYVDIPGAGRTSFVCPRLEAKRSCVVCTQANKLLATGNEADEKKGKKLLPSRRCYANVIDRSNPESGPVVFAFGRTIEQQLIELRKDEDEGGDFVHPVDGLDITIIRKGTTQFDTKYTVRPGKRGPLSAEADEMNEWIEAQHNLEKWCKVQSDEEIRAILRGEDPREAREAAKGRSRADDDDDDDDDLPAKPAAKKPVKAAKPPQRRRVEDDMDEVDEDDD